MKYRKIDRPGKYQGDPVFIPYLWESIGEYGETPDDDATDQMIRDFCKDHNLDYDDPEIQESLFENLPSVYFIAPDYNDRCRYIDLCNVHHVYLWEDDQGFVHYDIVTHYDIHKRDQRLAKFNDLYIQWVVLQGFGL